MGDWVDSPVKLPEKEAECKKPKEKEKGEFKSNWNDVV